MSTRVQSVYHLSTSRQCAKLPKYASAHSHTQNVQPVFYGAGVAVKREGLGDSLADTLSDMDGNAPRLTWGILFVPHFPWAVVVLDC